MYVALAPLRAINHQDVYVVDASLEQEMEREREELAHQGPEEIQQLARRIDRTNTSLGRQTTKELEEVSLRYTSPSPNPKPNPNQGVGGGESTLY